MNDAGELPASDDLIGPAGSAAAKGLSAAKGQFGNPVAIELVADVVVRIRVFLADIPGVNGGSGVAAGESAYKDVLAFRSGRRIQRMGEGVVQREGQAARHALAQ